MSGENRGGRNRKERPVRIEYVNMAGEQRTLETKERRRPDHPRRARTERKLFCVCGHEICLGCIKVTWGTKIAGESVRCCCCERDNSLHDLKLGPHDDGSKPPEWYDETKLRRAFYAEGYTGWVIDLGDGTCRYANNPLIDEVQWGDRVRLIEHPCGIPYADPTEIIEIYDDDD